MSEDFYIKFYSASSNEGDVHSRLAEPHERVDALLPLLYKLIQGETKPDAFQSCPICGQMMEVAFSKRFHTSTAVYVGVDCKTCNIILVFESNKVPSWVSVSNFWN